ncbi:YbaN family protein [Cytobacillus spongiae]|uniref:YbaN family protein n=1 Tax=Cytobacillus spongiae TaxID=2901381 RepID=UPI001F34E178|nr:YbaN family protein [Cytobacillus spongiae]UII56601.1 YbaN family protein [Cytobacillus spongiae]
MRNLLKGLYIVAGFLSLGLGIIGIILPVVPTTPLLLLASFCFVKGSERFEVWFKGTKVYKKHLENFVNNRSMTLKEKLTISSFADLMILIAFLLTDKLIVRFILVVIVLYKYYYFIFKIKTIKGGK